MWVVGITGSPLLELHSFLPKHAGRYSAEGRWGVVDGWQKPGGFSSCAPFAGWLAGTLTSCCWQHADMGEAVSLSGQVTGSLSLSHSHHFTPKYFLSDQPSMLVLQSDWKKLVPKRHSIPQEVGLPDGQVQDQRSAHPEPRPATVKRLGGCRQPGIRWRGSALFWCRGRHWCRIDSGAGVGAPSAPLHV